MTFDASVRLSMWKIENTGWAGGLDA